MQLFWCSWFKYRFIKLDLVTLSNFAFISSVVDCVNVNPSARLNHVLLDAQKVCALEKVCTLKCVLFTNFRGVPT